MRIAFFSPLNPIQSGISDYSEELLEAMHGATVGERAVDVDLFIDRGYRPSNPHMRGSFDVYPARDFDRIASSYDSILYQMGNSPAHAYIYNALLKHPGVVVMHEFILHHLRIWMALNDGKRKEYVALMEGRYGNEGREAARRVLLGQFPDALFKYPLSDEVIQKAAGIIVHSHYMERLVRSVRPDVPLRVVPMGVPLPTMIPKDMARARLGIPPGTFAVTSVGHLNPYKRVSATLRAFKALLMEVPDALYLLVGSRSPNYDPSMQIDMLDLSGHVKITGYVSQEDLPYYLAASDVCLNLRYPTAGETSASLLRIMGAGVPVLVSRTGSFEELPDDAAGKIDIGDIEEELLFEYLLLLARRPDVRQAMAEAARRYVAESHTLEGAARGYLEFLTVLRGTGETVHVPTPALSIAAATEQASAPLPLATTPQEVPAAGSPLPDREAGDPIAILAEAAAELGITEKDDITLRTIASAIDGLVPAPDARNEH
jgi:glycosyltransferase involved in cell wall biosynthesis